MRYLYISFFLCLAAGTVFSQTSADSVAAKGNPDSPRFFIRCQATVKNGSPLDILKASYATAIYGNRACNGVIIITTKAARMRQFLTKDLLEGEGVSGATLTFISLKNEKDSLRFAADEQGIVRTSLLKPGEEYKVTVSSVGYKN